MKKLPAILSVIASIPFFTLGILFLIAGINAPSRLLVAAVLLVIGIVLLVAGLRRLRRLAEISPDALRTNAVDLARRLGGELTVAQLRAEYRISNELAGQTLEQMVAEGTADRQQREDRVVYVVTGLAPSLSEKVCPYCGTELPMRTSLRKCPNCGGQLEIRKS